MFLCELFSLYAFFQSIIGIVFFISRDLYISRFSSLAYSSSSLFSMRGVALSPDPSEGCWEMCLGHVFPTLYGIYSSIFPTELCISPMIFVRIFTPSSPCDPSMIWQRTNFFQKDYYRNLSLFPTSAILNINRKCDRDR